MIRVRQIKMKLDHTNDDLILHVLKRLRIHHDDLLQYDLVKRSIDARNSRNIKE